MRLGIVTPVVSLNPRFPVPEWEQQGGIDDIVDVARAAERLGYDWVSCPEHVAIPVPTAADPGWALLGSSGHVELRGRVDRDDRLLTHVLVLGYHHPLEVVKRYGTLDVASGGRLILGVGVGSLQAEFELLGRAVHRVAGRRSDDALRAIRASFSRSGCRPTAGRTSSTRGSSSSPAASSPACRIWVGGRTRVHCAEPSSSGDGWIPFGLVPRPTCTPFSTRRRHGGGPPRPGPSRLESCSPPSRRSTRSADLEATAADGARLSRHRRHRPVAPLPPPSRDHYLEQLEAMAEVPERRRRASVSAALPSPSRPATAQIGSTRHARFQQASDHADAPWPELLAFGAATVGESGGRPMRARIRAVWPGARLAAPAFPVRCTPARQPRHPRGGGQRPAPAAPWSSTWATRTSSGTGARCSPPRPRRGGSPVSSSTAGSATRPRWRPTASRCSPRRWRCAAPQDRPERWATPVGWAASRWRRGTGSWATPTGSPSCAGAQRRGRARGRSGRADKEEALFGALRQGATTLELLDLDAVARTERAPESGQVPQTVTRLAGVRPASTSHTP